ncbi:MAG TPA: hypothetical protein PLJ26_01135, partial [Candidatus Omnitrophota bacterium]|nr:hypothetical protein [Candidatus Omnitrophota bacterium]
MTLSQAADSHSQARVDLEKRHQAWKSLLQEQKEKRNHLESEIERQRQILKEAKQLYEHALEEEYRSVREETRARFRRIAAEREEKQRLAFERARRLEQEQKQKRAQKREQTRLKQEQEAREARAAKKSAVDRKIAGLQSELDRKE